MEEIPERDLRRDCIDALAFRKEMDARIPSQVCAVCNSYCSPASFPEVAWTKLKDLKGLELLRCDKARTELHPRPGFIKYIYNAQEYCLQPAACKAGEGVNDNVAHICKDCLCSLNNKTIPTWSLARYDPGELPIADNPDEQLKPLSMLEANLLAGNRVIRYCYVVRPWGDPEQVQKKQKGHVIAFPNNTVDELLGCFPVPLKKIPEVIHCVFLMIASERKKKRTLAAQSKALHVRGKQIILWARHLAKVRGGLHQIHQTSSPLIFPPMHALIDKRIGGRRSFSEGLRDFGRSS